MVACNLLTCSTSALAHLWRDDFWTQKCSSLRHFTCCLVSRCPRLLSSLSAAITSSTNVGSEIFFGGVPLPCPRPYATSARRLAPKAKPCERPESNFQNNTILSAFFDHWPSNSSAVLRGIRRRPRPPWATLAEPFTVALRPVLASIRLSGLDELAINMLRRRSLGFLSSDSRPVLRARALLKLKHRSRVLGS